MIFSAFATAAMAGMAVAPLAGYDPQKHLDATFYDCASYGTEYFGEVNNAKNPDESKGQKIGILVWFEFDKNAEKPSYRNIQWKHLTSGPANLFNDVDENSYFDGESNGKWEIGALSDGHIAGHTHWDRINFYHKVTDQPLALMSVVQEERDDRSKIVLERVYHVKCDIFDDEKAFRLFREFAK